MLKTWRKFMRSIGLETPYCIGRSLNRYVNGLDELSINPRILDEIPKQHNSRIQAANISPFLVPAATQIGDRRLKI